jgi:hypothetical protein
MAISNGNYSFATGRDNKVIINGPSGKISLPNVISFMSKPEWTDIKSTRMDGVKLNAALPDGWSGELELVRGDQGVDQLMLAIESAWLDQGTYNTFTIYQFITEKDQSVSTWEYAAVALKVADAGDWKGDADVKQKITFEAQRRNKV